MLSSDTRIIVRIYTHAISNLRCCTQEFCFINEDTKTKGPGVPAVQFWKFLLEGGADVEKAIVNSKAAPLVHTTNNTEQVRASVWMSSSIQCGHPPDVIEKDWTTVIITAINEISNVSLTHSLSALKDADDRAVKKVIAVGIIDPVIESILARYASVYKVCSYHIV
jgi:hypothetical protein